MEKVDEFMKSIGCENGWMNSDEAVLYHKKYPYFSRDIGGEILELVTDSKDKRIVLVDATEFGNNNLSCEWSYVVNYHTNTLQVYNDFGGEMLKEYKLDKLPTEKTFVKQLNKIYENDY